MDATVLQPRLQGAVMQRAEARAAAAMAAGQAGVTGTGAVALRPGQTFVDRLNALKGEKSQAKQETEERAKAQKVAGDLVANALILPVMKQIRRSVWSQNTIFGGGNGEKAFGPEFDMQIADRIAHSPRMTVTAALADRLMARKQGKNHTASTTESDTKGQRVDLNG